jgi:ribonuclease E
MAKKMLIDATHAEETRVVVVDGNKVEEFDFETVNKRQLAGNIYLAKVTRVEPSLQAAFVDYGGNRHGFLAFSEIHPDYYQIPVADRQALLEEERAYAEAMEEEERRGGARQKSRGAAARVAEGGVRSAVAEAGAGEASVAGMDVIDLSPEAGEASEGAAPAEEPTEEGAREPYRAVDHASETDDEIESVAEEDVAEEIRIPRKPRPRRYKIQEVIKVRQIMLVQVVKEERGNKGAALTTYLSLAGRYCVLMPNTARGGGISRKITNAADRKKLKEIAAEMEVPEGAGLIIRTAGAQRTKAEVKRDYEYLMRLWEQIRDLTLKSIAPAPIYEEGNLIKRAIRDLYSREIDEVWVEGEAGYRTAKDFMKMIMPSHAKNVKLYQEPMPLFARYQVESYLSSMFNPVVQLKSGGYIVIGVTEALVAIDVNSGRATKEGSIEETALKTNLEAADEIARQLRLRDLAGLIVIDFIDMEERKNNAAVEKRLKERLKTDRARIQVGRISGFGLLEMSRQRLRPGMLEATTQACPHCHGTGLIRSDDNLALSILRQLEEEGTRRRSKEVLLRAPVGIVNFLMNQKREHIAGIEGRYGMAIRIEADPTLISPDFAIEKFKTATRIVTPSAPVVSIDTTAMEDLEEAEDIAEEDGEDEEEEEAQGSRAQGEPGEAREGGRKRRRRRRRRRGGGQREEGAGAPAGGTAEEAEETAGDMVPAEAGGSGAEEAEAGGPEDGSSRRRGSRGRGEERAERAAAGPAHAAADAGDSREMAQDAAAAEGPAEEDEPPRRKVTRSRRGSAAGSAPAEGTATGDAAAQEAEAGKPARRSRSAGKAGAKAPAAGGEPGEGDGGEGSPRKSGRGPRGKAAAGRGTEEPAAGAAAAPAAAPVAERSLEPEAVAAAVPEPEPAPQPVRAPELPAEAAAAPGEEPAPAEAKPKRRGWWSLGR